MSLASSGLGIKKLGPALIEEGSDKKFYHARRAKRGVYDKIFIRPDWDQEGPNFFIPRPEGANDIIIQVISVANKRPEYLVIFAWKL